MTERSASSHRERSKCLVCVAILIVSAAFAWWQWREARSLRNRMIIKSEQIKTMQQDAQAIQSLQSVPKLASDRRRPNEELVAQVDTARRAVQLPASAIQSFDPQPPRRSPQSDYIRMPTSIRLERIPLKHLVAFLYRLTTDDPSLRIERLQIARPRKESKDYEVELVLSYLIYSPRQKSVST